MQIDRQNYRLQTEILMDRQKEIKNDRYRNIDTQTDRQIDIGQIDIVQIDRQIDRNIDGQMDKYRNIDKKAEIQNDIQKYRIDVYIDVQTYRYGGRLCWQIDTEIQIYRQVYRPIDMVAACVGGQDDQGPIALGLFVRAEKNFSII